MFSPASRGRLTPRDLDRFPGNTLFDRLGRALCAAGVLPRKELFETWEVARRVRRRIRGRRIVDVAAGHGLLGLTLLLLDDTSPRALAVDPVVPPSSSVIEAALVAVWPRLAGRVERVTSPVETVRLAATDLVVSSHACGALTDRVLDIALRARAPMAVLPCCHDAATCDTGGLTGWMDEALAIDTTRALRVRAAGYAVWTQAIPAAITPKRRLLLGAPRDVA